MSQNFLEIDKQDAAVSNDKFEFDSQSNMIEHDLLSQRSAPLANLAADSDTEGEKESTSSEVSKNQPQNSPNAQFNEFFGNPRQEAEKIQLVEKQPAKASADNEAFDSSKDSKAESHMEFLSKMKDKVGAYEKQDYQLLFQDGLRQLQRPSVIIAIILSCILLSMSMNCGRLEREILEMNSKLSKYEKEEKGLDHELHDLKNQVKHVEHVEDDLIKKENKLEDKMRHESWGENEGEGHFIDMKPLLPHAGDHDEFAGVKNVMHKVKENLEQLRNNLLGDKHGRHGGRKHRFPFFHHLFGNAGHNEDED